MEIDPSLKWLLAVSMIAYLVVMYIIGWVAEQRIHSTEDFLVAGRRLPLSLAWMTLLATWFGAGTMLTAADEVRVGGLERAALDPFGAGVCLIIAGLFFAAPMWRMRLMTVPDFFQRRFGSASELMSALILIPSYFGWIAAQFTALAEVLQLFFGIPVFWGLLIVAVVGSGYTLMGGMWSVTLTDAVQISLVLAGLVVLAAVVLMELGSGSVVAGVQRIARETPPEMLNVIPARDLTALIGWLGVFAIGALGNLPGQDLMQRVFASNSARTAKNACLLAGVLYLSFGAIPLLLALAGRILFPEDLEARILPALAHSFLHPAVAVIFLIALLSAILSTIDSAILSPSSVLAQNVFPRFGRADTVKSNRIAVVGVTLASLVLACAGASAYELLEEAYLLTMVGLFVPLSIGLYSRPKSERPAIAAMITGMSIWAVHFVLDWEHFLSPFAPFEQWEVPLSLAATSGAALAYFCCEPPWTIHWRRQADAAPAAVETTSA